MVVYVCDATSGAYLGTYAIAGRLAFRTGEN
jgi:hypothetical protein